MPTLEILTKLCPRLSPRLYTIASSNLLSSNVLDIAISLSTIGSRLGVTS